MLLTAGPIGCKLYDSDLIDSVHFAGTAGTGGGADSSGAGGSGGGGGSAGADDILGPDQPHSGGAGGASGMDGGMPDAGPDHIGSSDAGLDAGPSDAGPSDAGPSDAGEPPCCELPNAVTECADGGCALVACAPGYDDCDGDPNNGCEQRLDDPSHCGACGRVCNLPHVAQHQCIDGQCRIAGCNPVAGTCAGCEQGYGNCQGLHANGCETELNSLTHCGGCGVSCVRTHAISSCDDGTCNFECSPGYLSCDFDDATGCESSVTTNERCGNCTTQCGEGDFCGPSGCTPLGEGCADPNQSPCGEGGTCVPIVHDEPAESFAHCGGCGSVCGPVPHATVRCTVDGCEIETCDEGYADCDGSLANGCEVDLDNSLQHCGDCNQVCSPPNATGVCQAGTCQIASCDADYDNCDEDAETGCETHLLSSDLHCGGCGQACIPFVAPFCRGGCCAWWSCTPPP